jgi:peptide/nickel transport system ATP-binding protein
VTLLEVDGLTVEFRSPTGWVRAIEDVSFTLEAGQVLGLVGESGSGKTVTAFGILGLIAAQGGRITSGRALLEGQDLTKLGERELSSVRGKRIGMVFQQPIRSLNPAFTIGEQIAETIKRHEGVSRAEARTRTLDLLERVEIPEPGKRAKQFPHEFSGGMCQRAMIAMALACSPSVLIADEPTTALDVTVQAVMLELLRDLRRDTGIGILFVSHDLGVIAEMADDVAVMYAGQVVETASVDDLFLSPRHPYTAGLMAAVPQVGQGRRLVAIDGNVPDPGHRPRGCHFHPRCPHAVGLRCDGEPIPLLPVDDSRGCRCIRVNELVLEGVTAE